LGQAAPGLAPGSDKTIEHDDRLGMQDRP